MTGIVCCQAPPDHERMDTERRLYIVSITMLDSEIRLALCYIDVHSAIVKYLASCTIKQSHATTYRLVCICRPSNVACLTDTMTSLQHISQQDIG
jgi:hypothetical protein